MKTLPLHKGGSDVQAHNLIELSDEEDDVIVVAQDFGKDILSDNDDSDDDDDVYDDEEDNNSDQDDDEDDDDAEEDDIGEYDDDDESDTAEIYAGDSAGDRGYHRINTFTPPSSSRANLVAAPVPDKDGYINIQAHTYTPKSNHLPPLLPPDASWQDLFGNMNLRALSPSRRAEDDTHPTALSQAHASNVHSPPPDPPAEVCVRLRKDMAAAATAKRNISLLRYKLAEKEAALTGLREERDALEAAARRTGTSPSDLKPYQVYFDAALNEAFEAKQSLIESLQDALQDEQDARDAISFTPDSSHGLQLLQKCQLLKGENRYLGAAARRHAEQNSLLQCHVDSLTREVSRLEGLVARFTDASQTQARTQTS